MQSCREVKNSTVISPMDMTAAAAVSVTTTLPAANNAWTGFAQTLRSGEKDLSGQDQKGKRASVAQPKTARTSPNQPDAANDELPTSCSPDHAINR